MSERNIDHVKFMGVKISNANIFNIKDTIDRVIKNSNKGYICVTDVGNVISATKDYELLNAINTSLISVADGMPLVWYAKMLKCKNIERVSGADLMTKLLSQDNGYRHFLLGDTERTINKVIGRARLLNRNVNISGYSPPFKEFNDEDNLKILNIINKEKADIIWVSFGGGKQEKWMKQVISKIDTGVVIGVGAAFKWLIGDLVTPPKIFQIMGLQWLFRITQQMIKDPIICSKVLIKNEIIKKKIIFLFNFPFEVLSGRRNFK
ncbi:MAG TPA: WecB/TagA/CpsF family glycosyltransferase [Negativicutes bacterium]|jgi:N-acetylglucosaminyldiphosphoundecaprenol N-acetyl-beta-D-mannosaminyltransferase